MGTIYKAVLMDQIRDEQQRKAYIYNDEDYNALQFLLRDINQLGYNFSYLAELNAFSIPGADAIIEKHILNFRSESTRAYLVVHLTDKKYSNLVFDMYMHFKNSSEYISSSGKPDPAHIYARYDNTFKRIKPKKLKDELFDLVCNPRDAFYLPFTTRMLASWKIPELKQVLIRYLHSDNLMPESVNMQLDDEHSQRYFLYMKKRLKYTGIHALRYYPSYETLSLLKDELKTGDENQKVAIEKTIEYMKSRGCV